MRDKRNVQFWQMLYRRKIFLYDKFSFVFRHPNEIPRKVDGKFYRHEGTCVVLSEPKGRYDVNFIDLRTVKKIAV